jgi:hydrogenase expression/formation protein HypE
MPDATNLPTGKLPLELLTQVLGSLTPRDPRVLIGARTGEDAAVLDFGETLLVVTTDPITFATDEIARYAVAVNANDVAVRGATPRWFLATLLLPPGTTAESVRQLMQQLVAACRELEIDLIGGHTEVTGGLDRPIISGTMLGEVARDRLVTTGGARPGDALVLGGSLAVEGTALLARESRDALLARGVPLQVIERAAALLHDPGISVVRMARHLCDAVLPRAMHDPTEGGLATTLAELAGAARAGVRLVTTDALPLLPETRAICDALGLDPLGLLASGALLAAVDPADAAAAVAALQASGAGGKIIGHITDAAAGLTMRTARGVEPLPRFVRDELARWFES